MTDPAAPRETAPKAGGTRALPAKRRNRVGRAPAVLAINIYVVRYQTDDQIQGTALLLSTVLLAVLCFLQILAILAGETPALSSGIDWIGKGLMGALLAAVGSPLRHRRPGRA